MMGQSCRLSAGEFYEYWINQAFWKATDDEKRKKLYGGYYEIS